MGLDRQRVAVAPALLLAGLVSFSVACLDPKPSTVVQWRAGRDWRCDESQVHVRHLDRSDLFEASGCGHLQVYDCAAGDCNPVTNSSR
jgi:hypothetical protein